MVIQMMNIRKVSSKFAVTMALHQTVVWW